MEKSLCFQLKPLAACGSKAIPRKQALITSLRDQTGVAAFLNMNRLPAGQGQQQHYSYNFIDFHEYISEFNCWQKIAYFTLQM